MTNIGNHDKKEFPKKELCKIGTKNFPTTSLHSALTCQKVKRNTTTFFEKYKPKSLGCSCTIDFSTNTMLLYKVIIHYKAHAHYYST